MGKAIKWLTRSDVLAVILRLALAVGAALLADLPPDVAGAAMLVGEAHRR